MFEVPQNSQVAAAYSTRETARILNVQPSTVRAAVQRGELPGFKFGRLLRIPRGAVEGLLCGQNDSGKPSASAL